MSFGVFVEFLFPLSHSTYRSQLCVDDDFFFSIFTQNECLKLEIYFHFLEATQPFLHETLWIVHIFYQYFLFLFAVRISLHNAIQLKFIFPFYIFYDISSWRTLFRRLCIAQHTNFPCSLCQLIILKLHYMLQFFFGQNGFFSALNCSFFIQKFAFTFHIEIKFYTLETQLELTKKRKTKNEKNMSASFCVESERVFNM